MLKIKLIINDFYKRRIEPLKDQNWKAIALCVITASIFWFFNALNKDYTTKLQYPITFVYNSDSLISTVKLPSSIEINVSGGGWQLFRKSISFSNTPLSVELQDPTSVKYLTRYSLMPLISDQFRELNINFVDSDTIKLGFEVMEEQKLALQIDTTKLEYGELYEKSSPVNITPDSLIFKGPSSFFDTLSSVFTLSPEMHDIDDDVNTEVSLSDYLPKFVKTTPSAVEISFRVKEYDEMQITVPITEINFPDDSSIFLQKSKVKASFWILDSKRDELDIRDFFIIADYMGVNPMDSTLKLDVIQEPDYVKNVTLKDDRVQILRRK